MADVMTSSEKQLTIERSCICNGDVVYGQECLPLHLPRDAKTLPLLLRTYGSGYCLHANPLLGALLLHAFLSLPWDDQSSVCMLGAFDQDSTLSYAHTYLSQATRRSHECSTRV